MDMGRVGEEAEGMGVDPTSVNILLSDKDAESRARIVGLLGECAYPVTPVETGREALALLRKGDGKFNLILKDHEPPHVNGFRLLRKLRRDAKLANIPVVIMSTQADRETVVESLHLGAVDYLVKPLRMNELRNLWTHVWRRKSGMLLPQPQYGEGQNAKVSSAEISVITNSGGSDDSGPERSSGQGNREDSQELALERGEQQSDDRGDRPTRGDTLKPGGVEETLQGQTMASAFLHYGQSAGTAAAAQHYQRLQGTAGSESGNPRGDRDSPEEITETGKDNGASGGSGGGGGSGSAVEANTKQDIKADSKPSSSDTNNHKGTGATADISEKDPWFAKAHSSRQRAAGAVSSPASLAGASAKSGGGSGGASVGGAQSHLAPGALGVPRPEVHIARPAPSAIRYHHIQGGQYSGPPPGPMYVDPGAGFYKGYRQYYESSPYDAASLAHPPVLPIPGMPGGPPAHLHPYGAIAWTPIHSAPPVATVAQVGVAVPTHATHKPQGVHGAVGGGHPGGGGGGGGARGGAAPGGPSKNHSSTPPSPPASISNPSDPHGEGGGEGGGGHVPGRDAALSKYRMKRNQRCFSKKIRYASRKQLAETRPRIKGQFVSYTEQQGDASMEGDVHGAAAAAGRDGGASGSRSAPDGGAEPSGRPAKSQRCGSPNSGGSGGSGGSGSGGSGGGSGGSNEQNAGSGNGQGSGGNGSGSGGSGDLSKANGDQTSKAPGPMGSDGNGSGAQNSGGCGNENAHGGQNSGGGSGSGNGSNNGSPNQEGSGGSGNAGSFNDVDMEGSGSGQEGQLRGTGAISPPNGGSGGSGGGSNGGEGDGALAVDAPARPPA